MRLPELDGSDVIVGLRLNGTHLNIGRVEVDLHRERTHAGNHCFSLACDRCTENKEAAEELAEKVASAVNDSEANVRQI